MNACLRCGSPARVKFCGKACASAWARDHETRACSVEGCTATLRAKGLCATHYNQTRGDRWHMPVTKPCAFCGKPVTKSGGGGRVHGRVCSEHCRVALTTPAVNLPLSHPSRRIFGVTLDVAYRDCDTCGELLACDARWPRLRHRGCTAGRKARFVAGRCVACATPFVADRHANHGHAVFCSKKCGASYHRKRRPDDRRPGWRRLAEIQGDMRCHLCGDDCDPDDYERRPDGTFIAGMTYPSVDHIHPLSRGGSNNLDNLALAHMLCNSWKSDTVAA